MSHDETTLKRHASLALNFLSSREIMQFVCVEVSFLGLSTYYGDHSRPPKKSGEAFLRNGEST